MSEEVVITIRGTSTEVREALKGLAYLYGDTVKGTLAQVAAGPTVQFVEHLVFEPSQKKAAKVTKPAVEKVTAAIMLDSPPAAVVVQTAPLTPTGTAALEAIRALLPLAVEKAGKAKVMEFLKPYNAVKASQIDPKDYVAVTNGLNAMTISPLTV